MPFFNPLLSNLRKFRGFTVVEVTIAVCAIVILTAITIIRVGEVRDAALDAQSRADAVGLQLAYDRAVNYQLDILTNDSVMVFATNAYDQALISQVPSANSLSKIFLAPGSHITNDTAAFITQTNTSSQSIPPPAVTFISPTSGQTFLAGQNITLSVAVSSQEYISQVVFFDNGATVGAAAVAPYNRIITTMEGSHIFSAIATSASGQTGTNQVGAAVNPNVPPLVYLYQPTTGSYPYTASLTLQAVASDPNAGGGITKLSIFAGSNQIATTTANTYSGNWSGAPGTYSFVAKAWDVGNAMTASAPISVTLLALNPPTITLNSPTSGQSFMSPTTVPLRATAVADGGPVAQVQYVIIGGPTITLTNYPFSYDWVNPSAGDYSVQALAYDNTGAQGQSATNSITVTQDIPPTVSLIFPTNESGFLTPITISITAAASSAKSTITNLSLMINGNKVRSLTSSPYTYSWVNPYAGTYTIYAAATDDHNVSSSSATNQVTIAQDQAPAIALTNPTNGATFLTPVTVQLAATATDPDDGVAYVDFIVDGHTIASVTGSPYTFNWVNPISGAHIISAIAYDQHTLSASTTNVTVIINQDLPPNVMLTSPSSGTVLAPTSIPLSATASPSMANNGGSITSLGFYTNGVIYTNITSSPYFCSLSIPLAGGAYAIQAIATDDLGVTNGSATATVTAIQDQPPSSVALTLPANGQSVLTPATVTLAATATDPDDGVARVDFMDGNSVIASATSAPYSFPWVNPGAGTHNLTAIAYDSKGLSLTSAIVSITVVADTAPTITLTSPSSGDIYQNPTNVTFAATASSSLSTISQVQFLLDNSVFATVTSAPYTTTWTNPTYGTHIIYAVATDNLRLSTSTTNVTIQAGTNYPPTIAWVTPAGGFSAIVPTNIALQVTATDPQNEVALVTITDQYGDTIYTSTSPAGPYGTTWTAGAGTYNLTATVYDQHGASDSATNQFNGIQSQAPSVALISPTNGQVYVTPANVTLAGSAGDSQTGNGVSKIEIYENGTLLATTNSNLISTNWSPGEGTYTITAKAYDNYNASQVSSPVSITVQGPAAPVVALNAPTNGTIFTNLDGGGVSVSMSATITDTNPWVSLTPTVDFYDGSTVLSETSGTSTFTDTTLADGLHALWVKVTDSYSQVGYSQTNNITVQSVASGDLNAPAVTLASSVASGSTVPTGTPVTFTATATNNGIGGTIADVQILVNDSSIATLYAAPYTYTWAPTSANADSIQAVAYTALNHVGASTNIISITAFVNQPPSVALTAPVSEQSYLGPTTINFSATASGYHGAIQRVDFSANGSVVGSATTATSGYYTFDWTNCTVGIYPVYATAYDVYGASASTTPITVNVSLLQPPQSVAITSPSSGASLPTPYDVVINASAVDTADGIANVQILTNNVLLTTLTISPYSFDWLNPAAGSYNLKAIAQNNGGIALTSSVVNVTISAATAPTVTWTSPSPASGTYRYNYPFTWKVTPSDTFTLQSALNVAFYDNGNYVASAGQAGSWTMTGYIPSAGATHAITAWTTNESGIPGSSPTLTIVMETNNPPTIALNSPTNGSTIAPFASIPLTATASDPDGDPVQVVFYVDNVPFTTNTTPSGNVFSSSTTFAIGSHTVYATAISYGFTIPSSTSTVSAVHQAPPIAFAAPQPSSSVAFNSPVGFSLTASPYDGASVTNISIFYDGSAGPTYSNTDSAAYTNQYTVSGSHTNTAIATDSLGSSSTNSQSITVAAHILPTIVLTSPAANGSGEFVQYAPALMQFTATAHDGYTITNVSQYVGVTLIGSATNQNGLTNYPTTLPTGNLDYAAYAMDSFGAAGSTGVPFTVVPYNRPILTVSPNNGSTLFPGTINLSATATDQAGETITATALYLNGLAADNSSSSPITLSTNLNAGNYTIYASATESSGTTYSSTNSFLVTNYPPAITISSPTTGSSVTINTATNITGTVTDEQHALANFIANGTTIATSNSMNGSFTVPWTPTTPGNNTITITAEDPQGNWATNSESVTVLHTAPSITFTSPTNGSTFVQYMNVTNGFYATAHDGATITNSEMFVDGSLLFSNTAAGQTNISSAWSVTTHTTTAIAYDNYGASCTNTLTFTFTTYTAPTVTTSPATTVEMLPGSTNISASAIDHVSETITNMALYVNGMLAATSSGASLSLTTNLLTGNYTNYATASDQGGTGYSATNVIYVQPTNLVLLLLHFDGNANDSSPYNWTPAIGNLNFTTSPAIAGQSVRFSDASGQNSAIWYAPAINMGTNDFTVQAWIQPITDTADGGIVQILDGRPNGTGSGYISIALSNGIPQLSLSGSGAYSSTISISAGSAVPLNSWTHIAVCRKNQTATLYVNGQSAGSSSFNASLTTTRLSVGNRNGTLNQTLNGYLDEYEIVLGAALYTGNFNPPIGPLGTNAYAPTVELTAPLAAANELLGSTVTLSGNAAGGSYDNGIQGVTFYDNGAVIATVSGSGPTFTSSETLNTLGAHNISVLATANSGNTAQSTNVTLTVYNAPAASLTSPAAGNYAEASVSISAGGTSAGSITNIKVFDGVTQIVSSNTGSINAYNWTTGAQGTHTLTAQITDSYGFTASSSVTTVYLYGQPAIILSPTNGQILTNTTITVNATVTDPNGSALSGVQLYNGAALLGSMTGGTPWTYTWTGVPPGSYTLKAIAADSYTTATNSVAITVANPPTANLSAPTNGNYRVGPVTITASGTSSGSITNIQLLDAGTAIASASAATLTTNWTGTQGTHTLTAKVTDSYGLTATSAVMTVFLYNLPTVNITLPTSNEQINNGASVPVSANVTANNSGGTITNVGLYKNSTFLQSMTSQSPSTCIWNGATIGVNTITAIATDSYGIKGSNSVSFTYATPPSLQWMSPANGATIYFSSNSVTLSAGAVDAQNAMSQVAFYDGATLLGTGTASGTNYNYTWNGITQGSHSVTAVASDTYGLTNQTSPAIAIYAQGLVQPSGWTGCSPQGFADPYFRTGLTAGQLYLTANGTSDPGEAYPANNPLTAGYFAQFIPGSPSIWGVDLFLYTTIPAWGAGRGTPPVHVNFNGSTATFYINQISKGSHSYTPGTDNCQVGLTSAGYPYFIIYTGTTSTVKYSITNAATISGNYYMDMMTGWNNATPPTVSFFDSIWVLR